MLREFNLTTPAELTDTTSAWTGRGAGVLHIVRDGQIIGAVAVEDKIRPESRAAVKALQDRGVKVAMITGDAQQVAQAVGQDLGIDEVFAEVLPQDAQGGEPFAMVKWLNGKRPLNHAYLGFALE